MVATLNFLNSCVFEDLKNYVTKSKISNKLNLIYFSNNNNYVVSDKVGHVGTIRIEFVTLNVLYKNNIKCIYFDKPGSSLSKKLSKFSAKRHTNFESEYKFRNKKNTYRRLQA